jgi:hypothetical protein
MRLKWGKEEAGRKQKNNRASLTATVERWVHPNEKRTKESAGRERKRSDELGWRLYNGGTARDTGPNPEAIKLSHSAQAATLRKQWMLPE